MKNALIDLERLEAIGGLNDPEVLLLVEEFIDGIPDYLSRIESALNPLNPEQLREAAHSIRGVAGMLGFQPLAVTAAEGDLGSPPADPQDWFARVSKLCSESIAAWESARPSQG
jgi:HPt (histidine-containing phosphotransfer) domain-containing protein